MTYNQLPVFNIVVDPESDEGLQLVSLVDFPAVCESFLKFREEHKTLVFATDSEQHIISGVSLLADTPIYRCDDGINGYYVVFTKQTIRELVEKYNRENRTNFTSLQHDGNLISDCVMVESYFIDKERGICPKEFEHCPDGSWITSYKVTNDELWNEIKTSGELNGFSVEITCQLEPAQEGQHLEEEPVSEIDEFWNSLLEWLSDGDEDVKKNFRVDRSEIASAIDRGRSIKIDEGGDVVEYWPHGLGKKDGRDIVVLYNPKTGVWKVQPLSGISEMIVTKEPIGEFDYSDPSYDKIIEDEGVTVSRTVHTSSFNDLIHNRVMTMMTYNDELPDPATGYRQVAIIAHGYTHAGNECIRVMEVYGDSRSAREGEGMIPDYRLMLTKRIQSLKPMIGTAPWGWDVLDSRVNLTGDKSMSPCITHITEDDLSR